MLDENQSSHKVKVSADESDKLRACAAVKRFKSLKGAMSFPEPVPPQTTKTLMLRTLTSHIINLPKPFWNTSVVCLNWQDPYATLTLCLTHSFSLNIIY